MYKKYKRRFIRMRKNTVLCFSCTASVKNRQGEESYNAEKRNNRSDQR